MTKLTTFSKLALNILTLLSCCLLASMPKLSAVEIKELSAEELNALHQCEKNFEYNIYFLGRNVGYLERTIKWHKNTALPEATVTSFSEVSYLWLDSTYQQTTTMQYSPKDKHFLTPGFSQKITGLKSRDMHAIIADNGLKSRVTLDTDISYYQVENYPLYDIDTLGTQIRLNLLRGLKHFTLSRQASSRIDTYHFEVAGLDVIEHKKWGKLTTIKVIEVGEHESIVLWFSSKHDHQLIKAELDMIFSPLVWLTNFSLQCEP